MTLVAASLYAPPAFGALFDRHGATLQRFLARRVDPSEAEGLLGEVFRIAFEKRRGFQQDHLNARPWLYGIAANVVAKHYRSEARRLQATARLAARRTVAEDPAEPAVPAADARARLNELVAAIAALPDPERQALLLFAWEELSYDEIAEALKVPVGTVRSRLNRARTRLASSAPAEGTDATVSCNRKDHHGLYSPREAGLTTAMVNVYVRDIDSHYRRGPPAKRRPGHMIVGLRELAHLLDGEAGSTPAQMARCWGQTIQRVVSCHRRHHRAGGCGRADAHGLLTRPHGAAETSLNSPADRGYRNSPAWCATWSGCWRWRAATLWQTGRRRSSSSRTQPQGWALAPGRGHDRTR